MTHMRVKIKDIRPNPFRDFSLYPIDKNQVQRLRQSMTSLGFFSGVTLRKANGGYEMAAGHHRLEAAMTATNDDGTPMFDTIEAVVDNYTDHQMVEIMMVENLTQRGHNAGSTLDSVAAYARIVAKDVLLGDEANELIRNLISSRGGLALAQTHVVNEGPSIDLLYHAMNRFPRIERTARKEADKNAEIISSTDIDKALMSLRDGGVMGRIMGEVYTEVEAIRAERAKAEQAEREKQERAAAAAEAKRIAEEEKQAKEVERRRAAEEKAERDKEAAKERDDKARAEADEKAKKAKADRKAAEKKQADQRKADDKARADAAKEKAKRDKAADEEREKREKERAAVKAQKERDAVYDSHCDNEFRLTSHATVFREAVLSPNGRRFIPKDQQLPLARQIRSEIDAAEKRSGRDLGSVTITSMIDAHLSRLIGIQRDIDKQEQDRLLRESAQKRVEAHWATMRRGMLQAEGALVKLVNEQVNWEYETALFPMHLDDIQRIIDIGRKMEKLKKALGY